MGSLRREVALAATAAEVWDAVRDYGELHTRLVPGFVTDTELDGRERIVTFAGGFVQREPIVDLDDEERRLVYTARDSLLGATHYNAAVVVHEDGDGSRLVWAIDFLPDEIVEPLDAAMARGIDAMRSAFG
jgi:carbon monoxide dehydrogenase subunit G